MKNAMLKACVAAIALSTLWTNSAMAADTLVWSVTMDGRHDDNVGFAPDEASKRDTGTYTVTGGVTWLALQAATRSASVSVKPFYKLVDSLEDLSNYGVDISFAGEQRLNDSFTAPVIALDVNARWREHKASEIRDGYVVDTDLSFGRQFNPYVGAHVGARFHWSKTSNSNPVGTIEGKNSDKVHELFSAGGFVKVDFNPLPKTALFIEYAYLTGDVAATGDSLAFNEPDAFDSAVDFAFEEGTDFLSWRIDADQNIYALGVSQVITQNLQVDATASYIDADGEFDNNYDNEVYTLGFTWTF